MSGVGPAIRTKPWPCSPGCLISGPGIRVIDVGAGTGKFTRQLALSGVEILAVEPSPSMRTAFARKVPDVELVDGSAEHIPAADASVDAVFVAQAFHWFDADAALTEIARVSSGPVADWG